MSPMLVSIPTAALIAESGDDVADDDDDEDSEEFDRIGENDDDRLT